MMNTCECCCDDVLHCGICLCNCVVNVVFIESCSVCICGVLMIM